VADRFHLAPLLRELTLQHDALVLALSERQVRLGHVFVNIPPVEIRVASLPRDAEAVAHRKSVNERAPSGRLQGSEDQKILLLKYARRVAHAVSRSLNGVEKPMILAAADPLASLYRPR